MKKLIFLSALSVVLILYSCNHEDAISAEALDVWNGSTRAENPLDEIDFSALDTAYFVNDKDVDAYVHFKELLAKGQGKDFAIQEIVPLGLNDKATLAYLLNYNEGWEIIAADKRSPIVLASGEEGSFSQKEAPDNVLAWIECLESDVLHMRTINSIPDDINEEAFENIHLTIVFWDAITGDIINENTRAGELDGYWELVSSVLIGSETLNHDHLIQTPFSNFHQFNPYNISCPWVSIGSSVHAPVGCVAVAGGMMLGYLHGKIGLPQKGPTYAYYTGTINNPQPNISPLVNPALIWDELNNTNRAADMLAFVGHKVNMAYGQTESLASTEDLVDNVFNYLDISCSYGDYMPSVVNNSLLAEMPAIISANGNRHRNFWGNYIYTDGHSFIIDAFRSVRDIYEKTYVWHYTYPSSFPRPMVDDRIEIVISAPTIIQYKMRWGWNIYSGHNNDDDWFSPSGDWDIHRDKDYNFIYRRKMITGFANQ